MSLCKPSKWRAFWRTILCCVSTNKANRRDNISQWFIFLHVLQKKVNTSMRTTKLVVVVCVLDFVKKNGTLLLKEKALVGYCI